MLKMVVFFLWPFFVLPIRICYDNIYHVLKNRAASATQCAKQLIYITLFLSPEQTLFYKQEYWGSERSRGMFLSQEYKKKPRFNPGISYFKPLETVYLEKGRLFAINLF